MIYTFIVDNEVVYKFETLVKLSHCQENNVLREWAKERKINPNLIKIKRS